VSVKLIHFESFVKEITKDLKNNIVLSESFPFLKE